MASLSPRAVAVEGCLKHEHFDTPDDERCSLGPCWWNWHLEDLPNLSLETLERLADQE